MKIGIISSYAWINIANNYGALLQYYALQEFLKQRGHSPFWIRSVLPENRLVCTLRYLKQTKSLSLYLNWLKCHKSFMAFVDAYLSISERSYNNYEDIRKSPPLADMFISGSDQVFGGILKENYLQFVTDNNKKLAYAASFGKDSLSQEMKAIIKPWLQQFRKISVRESSGVDICQDMGIKAIQLIDPTFLIDIETYPTHEKVVYEGKYSFSYFINVKNKSDVCFDKILQNDALCGRKTIVSSVQGSESKFPAANIVFPSPEEWLTYYRFANVIYTNTFHGTVFAILNHKPFVTILQGGLYQKQNCRQISLLESFGLVDRIWDGSAELNTLLNKKINWDFVEYRIRQFRQQASDFFEEFNI